MNLKTISKVLLVLGTISAGLFTADLFHIITLNTIFADIASIMIFALIIVNVINAKKKK